MEYAQQLLKTAEGLKKERVSTKDFVVFCCILFIVVVVVVVIFIVVVAIDAITNIHHDKCFHTFVNIGAAPGFEG